MRHALTYYKYEQPSDTSWFEHEWCSYYNFGNLRSIDLNHYFLVIKMKCYPMRDEDFQLQSICYV